MAATYAYVPAPGIIVPVINHLRSSFPTNITADTLKKLGFAPKNESYVINVLRFLGFLDENGEKTDTASKVFSIHDDKSFQKAFGETAKTAYSELFNLHKEKAWSLDTDSLITFFRQSDQTSAIVGRRQAATFKHLAAFSGYGEIPKEKQVTPKRQKVKAAKKPDAKKAGRQRPSTARSSRAWRRIMISR